VNVSLSNGRNIPVAGNPRATRASIDANASGADGAAVVAGGAAVATVVVARLVVVVGWSVVGVVVVVGLEDVVVAAPRTVNRNDFAASWSSTVTVYVPGGVSGFDETESLAVHLPPSQGGLIDAVIVA
jgi:hypothetical protein